MRILVAVVGLLFMASRTTCACSKEWMKVMIMNVCSYSKRHVSTSENQYEHWTMEEIDKQFTRIYGEFGDDDESLWKIGEFKEPTEKQGLERNRRKGRVKRYSMLNDAYFNLGVLERFLAGYDSVEEQKEQTKLKIKRNIRKLIEKCCKEVCTVDEFKGICH